ncbi:MAG: hypothetical protein ACOYM8_12880, partial [Caulobacterales bacterium]
ESDDRSGSLESTAASEPPAGPAEAQAAITEPVDFRQAARERRARQRELAAAARRTEQGPAEATPNAFAVLEGRG